MLLTLLQIGNQLVQHTQVTSEWLDGRVAESGLAARVFHAHSAPHPRVGHTTTPLVGSLAQTTLRRCT